MPENRKHFAGVALDTTSGVLAAEGTETPLRNRELRLLEVFFNAPGQVFSKAYLMDRLFSFSEAVSENAIEVYIARLRKHLDASPAQIETVRSIRAGIEGLIVGTNIITERLQANPLPDRAVIRSPDYVEAVLLHAWRYAPMTAAALLTADGPGEVRARDLRWAPAHRTRTG